MAIDPGSPHRDSKILERGAALDEAAGAVILLHGRGASAEDILVLGEHLRLMGVALLAPEAAGHTWYPNSFLAPIASNEPWLTSALELVHHLVSRCGTAGIGTERVVIAGFSQGACLASEFVARYPQRYGAVLAFTGGLIGPPGSDLHHAGELSGTPVLLSSGDPDPHVPWSRVEETAQQLRAMGAAVRVERYRGRPHTVLPEELQMARDFLRTFFLSSTAS